MLECKIINISYVVTEYSEQGAMLLTFISLTGGAAALAITFTKCAIACSAMQICSPARRSEILVQQKRWNQVIFR